LQSTIFTYILDINTKRVSKSNMPAVQQPSPAVEPQPTIKELFNSLIGTTFIPLVKLRATQIGVGELEVEQKRERLRTLEEQPLELQKYFVSHAIPVVMGPKGKAYITDHHHLGRALVKENYKAAPVRIDLDLSYLSKKKFRAKMVELGFVYPYDENGVKQPLSVIFQSKSLLDMKDDPYRSLAGFVRSAGGFSKVEVPYTEFQWANFFRTRISLDLINKDFDEAVRQATKLAHTKEAKGLPGYISKKAVKRAEAAAQQKAPAP